MHRQLKTIPKIKDSVWIIPQVDLFNYATPDEISILSAKVISLYKEGFPGSSFDGPLFNDIPYIFVFYIRGHYKSEDGFPQHHQFNDFVFNIVSTLKLEPEEKNRCWSLWNVCNDLTVKGGYMRRLFDILLPSFPKRTHLILHVAFKNPYILKAVKLYLEKGFYYVAPTRYETIALTMECNPKYSKPLQTLDQLVELLKIHQPQFTLI